MRKITFLVASLMLMLNATVAQDANGRRGGGRHYEEEQNQYAVDYRDAEPIVFMERGVEFLVFPNGDFDFNANFNTTSGYYGRRENNQVDVDRARAIRIDRDFNGRVRRVGNVYINYDFYGRVKRVGGVFISYNNFALTQIGGLRLFYNHHGQIVWVSGSVNSYRNSYNPCPAGYQNNDNDDYYEDDSDYNDDDYYYYKKDGKKEKMDKEAIKAIKKEYKELRKEIKKEEKENK